MDHSTLLSRSAASIPVHRTQLHPRMYTAKIPSTATPRRNCYIVAGAILTLAVLVYFLSAARAVHHSPRITPAPAAAFAVLLHAAPASTTVRIFQSLGEGPIPFVARDGGGPESSRSARPGLGSFADRAEQAGDSLVGLLDFAKGRVPAKSWGVTAVRFLVTGELGDRELILRERIMESCRRVLRKSGFLFRDEWASSITGQERGVYSWVATNYALGTLGGDPHETRGVMELGGPSAQVTLVSKEPPSAEFSRTVKVGGMSYNLYSASMMQLGRDAIWKSHTENYKSKLSLSGTSSVDRIALSPCIPRGYSHLSTIASLFNASHNEVLPIQSAGNFTACKFEILSSLRRQGFCAASPCKELPSISSLHVGPISVDTLYYASEFFGVVPRASLAEMVAAGKRYCEDDWINLSREHEGVEEFELLRYCFSSAYVVAILQDGLGIPLNDKRIGFSIHEEGSPVDWTLGAFILHMSTAPVLESEEDIIGNNRVMYLTLFAVLFLVLLAVLYTTRWRKPQMKTIYDLEKGRYIVTRLPR